MICVTCVTLPCRSFCGVTCSMNRLFVVSRVSPWYLTPFWHSHQWGQILATSLLLLLLHLPPALRSCSRSSAQPNLRICCSPGASWLGPASYGQLCYAFEKFDQSYEHCCAPCIVILNVYMYRCVYIYIYRYNIYIYIYI